MGDDRIKKGIIGLALLGVVVFALFLIFGNPFAEDKKVSWEGKTDGYESADEMEKNVNIIVKGEKLSEDETIVFDSEVTNDPAGGYTKSSFKISEVIKNSEDDGAISVGNTINISEAEFYDKNSKTTYTINDYENMKQGKDYVLYLKQADEGLYTTAGVTFGKIPINGDKTELEESDVNEQVNEVINEAQQEFSE